MYEIKSTYTNPERLIHIEIEQADTQEWCDKKHKRQVDRFFRLITGQDAQFIDITGSVALLFPIVTFEDKLEGLQKYCDANDRHFTSVIREINS